MVWLCTDLLVEQLSQEASCLGRSPTLMCELVERAFTQGIEFTRMNHQCFSVDMLGARAKARSHSDINAALQDGPLDA